MSDIIVKTTGLCADFKIKDRMVRAVNRVSLSLERGKTLVILGESGSGKSTYMKALLRILPKTAAVEGQAEFLGNDLFRMSEKEFRDIRGNRMAMIYQDSLSALDPMYKVGYQIVETTNEVLDQGKSYDELAAAADGIHYYVRKAAHMSIYFLLAITVSFPLYVYRIRGFWLMLLAGIICVGFAGLDEYHQSFVAGRSPGIRDVGFDSLGALIGILLVQLFCWSTLHAPSSGNQKRRKRR